MKFKIHKYSYWGDTPSWLPWDTFKFTAVCGYLRKYTTRDIKKVTCKLCLKGEDNGTRG